MQPTFFADLDWAEAESKGVKLHWEKKNGKVAVTVRKDGKEESYTFTKGDMFSIDKNVVHCFDYKEFTTLIVVYDKGVELPDGTKDIYPE